MLLILEVEDPQYVKPLKSYLESINQINKQKKIIKSDDSKFHIYTTLTSIDSIPIDLKHKINGAIGYEEQYGEENDGDLQGSNKLTIIVHEYLKQMNQLSQDEIKLLIDNIPKKWSVYPPMILYNYNSFDNVVWKSINLTNLFAYIVSREVFPDITHFAINQPIIKTDNEMRKPVNLIPLYGDFGSDIDSSNPSAEDFANSFWCSAIQNGIYQTWCPKHTMFSRGNIKEKSRILTTYKSLKQSIVMDLYCGIGYFSLSYLKNDAVVFCWDLNPWSIEGFKRSLIKNKFPYRIFHSHDKFNYSIYQDLRLNHGVRAFVFLESNEMSLMRLQSFPFHSLTVSHINLGLLPSSYQSWSITKSIIKNYNISINKGKTLIHIHENYHIRELPQLIAFIKSEFASEQQTDNDEQVKGINKVKSYAPDIWHVVVDITF